MCNDGVDILLRRCFEHTNTREIVWLHQQLSSHFAGRTTRFGTPLSVQDKSVLVVSEEVHSVWVSLHSFNPNFHRNSQKSGLNQLGFGPLGRG